MVSITSKPQTVEGVKDRIKVLEAAMNDFQQFQGVTMTPYRRKEMAGLIKKYVEKEGVFRRVDKDKVVELHYYPAHYNMAAAIYINKCSDNTFGIADCRLVATLEGLYEQLQEWDCYQ